VYADCYEFSFIAKPVDPDKSSHTFAVSQMSEGPGRTVNHDLRFSGNRPNSTKFVPLSVLVSQGDLARPIGETLDSLYGAFQRNDNEWRLILSTSTQGNSEHGSRQPTSARNIHPMTVAHGI